MDQGIRISSCFDLRVIPYALARPLEDRLRPNPKNPNFNEFSSTSKKKVEIFIFTVLTN